MVSLISQHHSASISQNGCAGIYPAMLAIMVAPVANVDIDLPFVLTLIGVVIISSFGVAGVGGGATFIYPSIINFKSTSCTCRGTYFNRTNY